MKANWLIFQYEYPDLSLNIWSNVFLTLGFLSGSWRRQWHPTPVLLPGKSHGRRSLVGCGLWGRWKSDTTEQLHFHFSLSCIGEGNGTHSSILAWRIPGAAEPGGLLSMGSHRVGHDWSDLVAAAAALVHTIKNPPAMWETWVWSLRWEDPLQEDMATCSSILAWTIPWTEEPGGLLSH